MEKYLLTYVDALRLVDKYDDFNYSSSETEIEGYKVVTFTYFLCEYKDFVNPIEGSIINGFDMRGSTFVFNKDGSYWKHFYMIPKFFNLNQVESTQYSLVKDKKIRSVGVKEDGSLVAFMQLPNGNVFAKTIGGFSNSQCEAAMGIYNSNDSVKEFVDDTLAINHTPLFEYVSIFNRIVLKYSKTELRLLGIRNNLLGNYVTVKDINLGNEYPHLVKAANVDLSLDEIIDLATTNTDKEGWVVEFEDGQLIKIKTEWYFNHHGLRTENIFREDYVIKNYLEEKLDDLLAQLDPEDDSDAFKFVEKVISAVDNRIRYIDDHVRLLVDKYYDEYAENWVKFATEQHKTAFFGLAKTKIESLDAYKDHKVQFVIKKYNKLEVARTFVDEWTDLKDEIITKWRGN